MVVKTLDIRTPCYSDIYNIINNYTNTYYLYTLLFAKLYTKNVINKAFYKHAVASFMGAWIETELAAVQARSAESHPLWVRGLKQQEEVRKYQQQVSHPLWVRGLKLRRHLCNERSKGVASFMGAWIETWSGFSISLGAPSHPLWVRGLKR